MPYQRGGQRLLKIAEELGFTFLRTSRGGRHALLVHRQTGAIACVPLSVSECGRDFSNYRAGLQRAADVAARPVAVDPCRPSKPHHSTGEATQRAERIAARLDNANHVRIHAAIERRDKRVGFYARLMSARFEP